MDRTLRLSLGICGALLLVTAALYGGILGHGFLNYDDLIYVTENVHVTSGLSPDNLAWALGSGYAANWHPVTWLSHMLDVTLFGLDPRGHHLVSLVLHALNACLLFLVLSRMTGALWRSALVAALFALHPMHVESVAWVAERKDLLSAFFGLLALASYHWYAQKPGALRYGALIACFALGLMSKPMLVTLPFLLLVLDIWPLNRWEGSPARECATPPLERLSLGRLFLEKLPLVALSAASSVVTVIVQQKGAAVHSLELTPLSFRIANALVAYLRYLGKTLWPGDLSILYPLPKEIPLWLSAGSGLVLAALSCALFLGARRRPYLLAGWLWFLGTLVPVIGLVQVGRQSMADRYNYLPSVGLFLMAVWGVGELAARRPRWQRPLAAAAICALAGYGATAWSYQQKWSDSVTLFSHAIAVTGENPYMHYLLGNAYLVEERYPEALAEYDLARRQEPQLADAWVNAGIIQAKTGNPEQAARDFARALALKPDSPALHYNLAVSLHKQGNYQEAVNHYRALLQLDPSNVRGQANLGSALLSLKRYDEAARHFDEALRLDPGLEEARSGLAECRQAQLKTK
jgi:Tfp pilus assembly protein PilF